MIADGSRRHIKPVGRDQSTQHTDSSPGKHRNRPFSFLTRPVLRGIPRTDRLQPCSQHKDDSSPLSSHSFSDGPSISFQSSSGPLEVVAPGSVDPRFPTLKSLRIHLASPRPQQLPVRFSSETSPPLTRPTSVSPRKISASPSSTPDRARELRSRLRVALIPTDSTRTKFRSPRGRMVGCT